MARFLLSRIFALVVLTICLFTVPAWAFQSYFINREIRADSIQMFPKWTEMLSRYNAEAHTLEAICGDGPYSPCKLKDWKDFLTSLKGKDLMDQVEAVNSFINRYPYIEDIVNWGVSDYWETPYEFQRRNGDCEDFAIAKYMSLRALGITPDILRVTILRDLNLGGIIHAILVVNDDDTQYVLDNQIKQVVEATKIYHYLPVYAINERHWWQYFMIQ